METSDVDSRLETPTRQRWLEILLQHAGPEALENRRTGQRHSVEFGSVSFSFEDGRGRSVQRGGRLLNASESGLMIRQFQDIPSDTQLQIEATIGEESFALAGRVAHCTQTLGGFKVGIELEFPD